MKKIVIHSPKEVSQDIKDAAAEAVQDFIDMFPEYKDSFVIEHQDTGVIQDKIISQSEYDAMPDNDYKRQFVKSGDRYILTPQDSAHPDKINLPKLAYLLGYTYSHYAKDDLPICLVNRDVVPFCYGFTGGTKTTDAIAISTVTCQNNKEFIKTIIIHELGHAFNATYKERINVHNDANLGPHCTNADCIMGESNYSYLNQKRLERKQQGRPPFCDECITAIRECMAHMPELTRAVEAQTRQPQPTNEFRETLPVYPHNSLSWKKDLRLFYKQVAVDNNYEYKENLSSQNYMAKLKKADGSVLDIEANNEYHVALGATDTQGHSTIPSLKDMRDLVKYAQSKNSGMNFAPNNEPEFNARLMIACLEAQPRPLKMRNNPRVTQEFLAQLDPQTRQHLQNALHPQTQRQSTGRTL